MATYIIRRMRNKIKMKREKIKGRWENKNSTQKEASKMQLSKKNGANWGGEQQSRDLQSTLQSAYYCIGECVGR